MTATILEYALGAAALSRYPSRRALLGCRVIPRPAANSTRLPDVKIRVRVARCRTTRPITGKDRPLPTALRLIAGRTCTALRRLTEVGSPSGLRPRVFRPGIAGRQRKRALPEASWVERRSRHPGLVVCVGHYWTDGTVVCPGCARTDEIRCRRRAAAGNYADERLTQIARVRTRTIGPGGTIPGILYAKP